MLGFLIINIKTYIKSFEIGLYWNYHISVVIYFRLYSFHSKNYKEGLFLKLFGRFKSGNPRVKSKFGVSANFIKSIVYCLQKVLAHSK